MSSYAPTDAVTTVRHSANSADSHVLEPADLWESLPAALRDRGPRARLENNAELVFFDGQFIRRDPLDYAESIRPPGAHDPRARLRDLDTDGIWGEALFPSMGLWIYLTADPVLAMACAEIYNDWLRDTFLSVSDRFIGAGLLPVADSKAALAEFTRLDGLGYQAALLPAQPPGDIRYNDPAFEPLWDAAEQTGIKVCLHVGTGHFPIVERGGGGAIVNYVESVIPTQRALAYFVSSGVLDRHPRLRLLLVEGGVSWLPGMMDRLEEGYRQHARFVRPKLSLTPSELIRRQVSATFQHDRALLETVAFTGVEALLWGSDYPHLEGTWPHTKETLEEVFAGTTPEIRQAITYDNFANLFSLPVPPGRQSDA